MKNLSRRVLVLMVTVMLFAAPLKAQIFIADDEFEGILRQEESEYVLVVPNEGHDGDMYTPLGEGTIVLTVLGAAYLFYSRRKQKK